MRKTNPIKKSHRHELRHIYSHFGTFCAISTAESNECFMTSHLTFDVHLPVFTLRPTSTAADIDVNRWIFQKFTSFGIQKVAHPSGTNLQLVNSMVMFHFGSQKMLFQLNYASEYFTHSLYVCTVPWSTL